MNQSSNAPVNQQNKMNQSCNLVINITKFVNCVQNSRV